jgi:putative nucleotidyltransferase with HDIG domain
MSRTMDRAEALGLVSAEVRQQNLVKHCVATECIMEALARRMGADEGEVARWGLTGLLHDLDYSATAQDPSRHGLVTEGMLRGSVDEEIIHAILAHADKVERASDMDKALWAADPTTGFIVAAALVRPDRDLRSVEVRSLLKRWKERSFAKGADREQMDSCVEIGLTREDFLALSLAAMQDRSEELGF